MWKWLFDSKNRIDLNAFKGILYAGTSGELESNYEDFVSGSQFSTKYPQFVAYLEDRLFELRYQWGISFRSESGLRVRSNHTNNIAEAQFLIVKENILHRMKKYNVVELFGNLVVEMNEYYVNKLLSIASGSNDMFVSRRYAGKDVKKGELGFQIPNEKAMESALSAVVALGGGIYSVPNLTMENSYLVNMNLGLCECHIGLDGSPCKHQYILWCNRITTSPNFLPLFDSKERKQLSLIATGEVLSLDMYEGIHDRNLQHPTHISRDNQMIRSENRILNNSDDNNFDLSIHDNNQYQKDEAMKSFDEVTALLKGKIETGDPSFLKSIVTFHSQVVKMSNGQLTSAMVKFGKEVYLRKSSVNCSSPYFLKGNHRGKISVQPTSVQRRRVKNGSKRAQPKGTTSAMLPIKPKPQKRPHSLSKSILNNQSLGKKHQSNMHSITREKCIKTSAINKIQ